MKRFATLTLALALVACGDSGSDPAPDAADDTGTDTPSSDAADDTAVDAALDTAVDTTPDAVSDTDEDALADTGVDVPDDTLEDADAIDAQPDAPDFSDWDYRTPWEPPVLEWSTCDVEADGSLAAKAAYYDWIVPTLHQVAPGTPGHEDWSRVFDIRCDAAVPTTIVADDELPYCTFDRSENNGLWTGLYVASQAYRYAVTGEADALDQVLRTLRGTHRMMRITGAPGLYTRDFRDPSLPQQNCPEDPMDYVPMGADMIGNRWVMVGEDGCFLTWDPALNEGAGDWVRDADHCTSEEFAGYCWQRNVSKDEYAGQIFAAVLVAKLVDDEEAQELATTILEDVTRHLIANEYWITDYDGRKTRYGSAHAMSLDHLPGFNALLALGWTRAGLSVTQAEDIEDFHYGCLLQERETDDCIDQDFEQGRDYRSYFTDFALRLGCQTNYDNVNIANLAYTGAMLMEPDPAMQAQFRDAFHRNSRGPDVHGRDLWSQGNPHLNFTLAALMGAEPESPEDAQALVHDGVCRLYEFRSDNVRRAVDGSGVDVECVSERHGELAAEPRPMTERCSSVYEWWGDPNQIENCPEELDRARAPAGYLLPYWQGRYFGFISEDM